MEWEPFIRLIAAAGFAAVIGLDRELRAKPAGLRTNIVVGVAAGAFAYTGMNEFSGGDPSRVAAQIVSGIGFLGGGAIFAAGGKPHGLTTAAALWGSAAAGLAAGVGAYATGFALVAVTIVALWPLDWATSSLLGPRRRTDTRLAVVVRDLRAARSVRALLHESGVRVDCLDMRPFGVEGVAMELVVHATRSQLGEAFSRLRVRDDVLFISGEAVSRDDGPESGALRQGQEVGRQHPHAELPTNAGLPAVRRRGRRDTGRAHASGHRRRQQRHPPRRQPVASKGAGSLRGANVTVRTSRPTTPLAPPTATTTQSTSGSTRADGAVTLPPAPLLTSWHSATPPTRKDDHRRRHAIRGQGLVKRFGDTVALDGVDLLVRTGTLLGLLGPNGAGKTTAVRILATLLQPDAGYATVGGYDVVNDAHRVRQLIGLTGQYAAVDETLTGMENLLLIGRLLGIPRRQAKERARELLSDFNLTDVANRAAKTYSGGMRRRLDLAASLVGRPPILYLDEPTTGLDPRARSELWNLIRSLVSGGVTVLLTTQYLDEVDELADEIVVLDRGRVIATGRPDELKAKTGAQTLAVRVEEASDLSLVTSVVGELAQDALDVNGQLVTAQVADPAVLPAVVRRLDDAGVVVTELTLRSSSLDEVFLSLTGRPAEESEENQEAEASVA